MIYPSEQASDETGDRYYDAVAVTCNLLANHPLSGAPFVTTHPQFAGLRRFPVTRPFEKYILFYKPTLMGVEVFRLLHSARDLEAALEER